MALLEARGLTAQYGWTRVLHGVDFAVEAGGITTILGANGAGKTTTLRAVCGMVGTSPSTVAASRAGPPRTSCGSGSPTSRKVAGRS